AVAGLEHRQTLARTAPAPGHLQRGRPRAELGADPADGVRSAAAQEDPLVGCPPGDEEPAPGGRPGEPAHRARAAEEQPPRAGPRRVDDPDLAPPGQPLEDGEPRGPGG